MPPAEFRFKKGTCGNLKGRPPKERALVATKFGGQPGIGFESRIKAIAIEEAYRLITVREGDRHHERLSRLSLYGKVVPPTRCV